MGVFSSSSTLSHKTKCAFDIFLNKNFLLYFSNKKKIDINIKYCHAHCFSFQCSLFKQPYPSYLTRNTFIFINCPKREGVGGFTQVQKLFFITSFWSNSINFDFMLKSYHTVPTRTCIYFQYSKNILFY